MPISIAGNISRLGGENLPDWGKIAKKAGRGVSKGIKRGAKWAAPRAKAAAKKGGQKSKVAAKKGLAYGKKQGKRAAKAGGGYTKARLKEQVVKRQTVNVANVSRARQIAINRAHKAFYSTRRGKIFCKGCGKIFPSRTTYANHLKKHVVKQGRTFAIRRL